MDFVHTDQSLSRTIAAVATPPGEGGVAIIRISGEEAIAVADRLFSRDVNAIKSYRLQFGKVLDEAGHPIDEILLAVMRAPRSFTGEDVVEIHCHGGRIITERVLARILACGAEPAAPGEFSQKAYLNGKLDLAQAEAIQQLIAAKSGRAADAAEQQLSGALSRKVSDLQQRLTGIAAIIEAWVDYPEEGLEFATEEELLADLEAVHKELAHLQATFRDGRILTHGINLCILGAPNVGKSSLMNALLGYERAIVTDIAGTTRDVLQEELRLGDLHFNLIDTAGIRETTEVVEQEGIRRSHQTAEKADLILAVLDSSRPLTAEEQQLVTSLPASKTLLIWNKSDIAAHTAEICDLLSVHISARQGTGLDELTRAIHTLVWEEGPPSKEEIVITQERHHRALTAACEALAVTIDGLRGDLSAEFISFDLRGALKSLGTIIGTNITEDILGEVFSKFCVGK